MRLVVVVLGLFLVWPLAAQSFGLIEDSLAASLSNRTASRQTRAVLLHGAAKLGQSARPVSYIDGGAESIAALADLPALLDLALSWRLGWNASGGSAAAQAGRFRETARQWLEAWLKTCRTQFMPLNESRLDSLVIAWDLLRAAAPPELQVRAMEYFRALAEGYLVDRPGQPPARQGNCWQSHRLKLAVLASFALGDPALIAACETAFRRQLELNLFPDGSPRDFYEHDSLAYAVYDLQPLLLAALAAARHGRDWYHWRNSAGVSLEQSLLCLSGYAAGRVMHP